MDKVESNTTVSPDITRYYDNPNAGTFGKGKFWYDYAGGDYSNGQTVEHKAIDSYDALGRPLSVRRHFKTGGVWSGAFTTSQTYDLAGNVKTKTYPSGHSITNTYDAEGKLSQFTGNLGNGTARTYSTGITYNAQGQMLREQFGTATPLYHNRHYNRRGQLYDVRLGASSTDEWTWNRGALRMYFSSDWTDYNASPTYANNNGNVYRLEHFVPDNDAVTSWSMSADYFGYDALNRVTGIAEHTYRSDGNNNYSTFSQNFSYDRFGNRLVSSSNVTGVPNLGFKVVGTNNRLIAPTDVNGNENNASPSDKMRYDQAGNLIRDSHTQSAPGARTYDVENRMLTADGPNGLLNTYTCDADVNRRVIVRADLNTTGDAKLVSIMHYDQLGRVRLSRQLEDAATQSATDETHGIKVQTRYYAGSTSYPNAYLLVSNPYRAATSGAAGNDGGMGWSRTKSDPGGRLIEAQTFGGATLPAPWGTNTLSSGTVTTAYDDEAVTVTLTAQPPCKNVTGAPAQL